VVAVVGRQGTVLNDAVQEMEAAGAAGLAVVADLSRVAECDAVVEHVVERFGRIDILVNNAAFGTALKGAEAVSEAEFDAMVAVNLRGSFFLATAAARQMITRGGGSIINISSIAAATAAPRAAVYSATKGAIEALTRTLAVEWARHGIRVNAIAPGYVSTDLVRSVADEKVLRYIIERTPLGRMAEARELVGAAVYLASDEASFQTGEIIRVDGGWTAW
jgi:NAD(P)-dependent dehydrogenase (short-subunit alcohol dehydrogenase family)